MIFAAPGIRGRKPDQIYDIMEAMLPGALKVELFATNVNIRPGWLSLGNQFVFSYFYFILFSFI